MHTDVTARGEESGDRGSSLQVIFILQSKENQDSTELPYESASCREIHYLIYSKSRR